MEPYLLWILVGFTLMIVELFSGTFYLLMLGGAAFGGALLGWLGQGFPAQAAVSSALAAVGCYLVHAWHKRNAGSQMASIDAGQPASFESWTDEAARLARVRYRGAAWDARVAGGGPLAPGAIVYVTATEGSTLRVTTQRPA
jgi:membrane protein implicated in regulation of membrane protease activity